MTTPEQCPAIEQEPDGVRWLKLLGFAGLIGTTLNYKGKTIPAENFANVCGDPAIFALRALEHDSKVKDPEDPEYKKDWGALRDTAEHMLRSCGVSDFNVNITES